MKYSKKIISIVIVMLLLTLTLPITALADYVRITDRNPDYQYFDYLSSSWEELKTPKHMIRDSSPEIVAFCLEHTNDMPGSTYYNSTNTPFSYLSSRAYKGLLIILEYGYPYNTPSGLMADQARYATANVIRFWLSEEGAPNQYNFTNLKNVNVDALAQSGYVSGSTIRSNSSPGSLATLRFAINLLKKARNQNRMPHTVNFTPATVNVAKQGNNYVATSSVSLTNLKGGYTLNQSGLPPGSSVSGFTGKSGENLTITIPVSAVSSGQSITLTASGSDSRVPANLYWSVSDGDPNKQDLVYMGTAFMPVGNGILRLDTPNMGYIEINKIDAKTGANLLGAVFKIIDSNGNEADRLTTNTSGYAKSIELTAATYSIQEITAPNGYLLDTTVHGNIRVTADNTTMVNLTNEIPSGVIRLTKSNANSSMGDYALNGAVFEVSNSSNALVDTITTDNQGKANTKNLPLGTYTVKEITAPNGYILNTQIFNATLSYDSQTVAIVYAEVAVSEQPQVGRIRIEKTNADTSMGNYSLSGASFEIRNSSNVLVDTVTTDNQGQVTSKNVPLGAYTVKEIIAPNGYVLNTETFDAELIYGGQTVSVVYDDIEIPNEPQTGTITITKHDSETGSTTQGDATLDGVIFEIYDSNGGLIERLECGDSNNAISKELPLGTYTIKEIEPPNGYLLNTTSYLVEIEYSNQNVEINRLSYIISDEVIKGRISIVKIAEMPLAGQNITNPKPPLQDVEFEIRMKSTNELVDTLITDAEGKAQSIMLPYGTYTVTETQTTQGYILCEPFNVFVNEDGKVYSYLIENEVYKSQVKIIKVDSNTGEVIPIAGTEFQIRDSNGELIVQTVTYPQERKIDTFVTDESGMLTLPEPLIYGDYSLYEIIPPHGYWLNETPLLFTIDDSGTEIVEVEFANRLIQKRIRVIKSDDRDSERRLAGAIFEVFKGDELVDTVTTNENGYAETKLLLVGDYHIAEVEAPIGFILDEISFDVTIDDGDTMIYTFKASNRPTEVMLTKIDISDETSLPNAHIEIYNADNELVFEGDTDDNGELLIQELPIGVYTFIEKVAPVGYTLNETVFEFEILENGEIIGATNINDTPTEVTLSKIDLVDGRPVPDAEIEIINADGESVFKGKTDENGEVTVTHLPIGTYTFKETVAPDGYILSIKEIEFSIDEYGVITGETEMTNSPTALNIFKVKYEDNSPLTGAGFKIKNWFGLNTMNFTNNDDGTYRYDKDGEVKEILVDENGQATIYGLPFGNYWLEESTVPTGFYPTAPVKITISEKNDIEAPYEAIIPNSVFVKLGLDRDRYNIPIAIGAVILTAAAGLFFIIHRRKRKIRNV